MAPTDPTTTRTLIFTPFASSGLTPAYLARGLLPHGRVAFVKRATHAEIARERRAVQVAHRLGIGHLVVPVVGWWNPQDGHSYLVSRYHADAVMLARHPHGAARLRALAEWEKIGLLRWQQATGDNDRHAENYLVLPGGRVLAIDYGAAYRDRQDAPEGGGRLATGPHENAVWHRAWRGGERAALARWRAWHAVVGVGVAACAVYAEPDEWERMG